MTGHRVVVLEHDEGRVEALLRAAERAGTVHAGQWDGSRGFFWFNGVPGSAMRSLRKAIGGESVRESDNGYGVARAARRVGNRTIAPDSLEIPALTTTTRFTR